MSDEERRKRAFTNLVIFLVAMLALFISVFWFLIVNNLIDLSDHKIVFITAPLVLGIFIGLFFGLCTKPKRMFLEGEEKIVWKDIALILGFGMIIWFTFKASISFFVFVSSSLVICRFIMALHYLKR